MTVNNIPKVIIIILNWNDYEDTEMCLDSIKKITYPNYFILLYDNGSTDESPKRISEYIIKNPDLKIKFIQNDSNLGFTKGCNIGMESAFGELNADWVLLLNNDIKVDPNFLSEMISKTGNPNVGMVQPLMLRMDNNRIIDSTGHIIRWGQVYDRGNAQVNVGQFKDNKNLIGASGAAALYKREMIENIGMFDKTYVSGYEDSELSWRAWKKGWKTEYAPNAIIYHKRSTTLNKLLKSDINFKKKFNSDAPRPCKTHGNIIHKVLYVVPYLYFGIKSEIGKRIGKNDIGGSDYFNGALEMLK